MCSEISGIHKSFPLLLPMFIDENHLDDPSFNFLVLWVSLAKMGKCHFRAKKKKKKQRFAPFSKLIKEIPLF